MWTAPKSHAPRAPHAPAGGRSAPKDEAGSALPYDPLEVGLDAEFAQIALRIDQPTVSEDRARRRAGKPPVGGGVTVEVPAAHVVRLVPHIAKGKNETRTAWDKAASHTAVDYD